MRHLREFEEWNPDEWDDDALDREKDGMSAAGFKEFETARYEMSINFPIDYEVWNKMDNFNGMILNLECVSMNLKRSGDDAMLKEISNLCSAGGSPIGVHEIVQLTDGDENEITIDASSKEGMDSLIRFYEFLDSMISQGEIDLQLSSKNGGFGDPPFIYVDDYEGRVSADDCGNPVYRSFKNVAAKDIGKKLEILKKGGLAQQFALATAGAEDYRENIAEGVGTITISRTRKLDLAGIGSEKDQEEIMDLLRGIGPDSIINTSFEFKFDFK